MKRSLLLIFFAAFVFRLIGLDQSLWLDEAATAKVAKQLDYLQIIPQFSFFDFHPPLYYLFMKFWTNIFGYTEIALRAPSIMFSLITGLIIYHIGKFLKNESAGIWACIFFLFNPLIIYYSQEARMYMMATCFLTAAFYYYLKLLKSKTVDGNSIFQINFFFFLSFMTFYGTIFFMSGLYVWLLIKKHYRLFFLIIPGLLLAILSVSPLLYGQLSNAKITLKTISHWSSVLGTASLKNLALIPLKFATGRISFAPKMIFFGLSGVWTVLLTFFYIQGAKKEKILGFLFLYVLVIAVLFSFLSPLLQYFRFLYLIPLVAIALGLATHTSKWKYIIAAGFVVCSLIYLLFPQFYREDWKSLARELPPKAAVYIISSFSDPILYYRSDIKIRDIRWLPVDQSTFNSFTIVPYGVAIYGLEDYRKYLFGLRYRKASEKSYREVTLEQWSR